jgi:hypothetical protein
LFNVSKILKVRIIGGRFTSIMSSFLTFPDGFVTWSLTKTCFFLHASVACERVLYTRIDHKNLSILTCESIVKNHFLIKIKVTKLLSIEKKY